MHVDFFFIIIIPSTAVGEALKMFNIQYRQPYAGRRSEGFLEIILWQKTHSLSDRLFRVHIYNHMLKLSLWYAPRG